MRFNSLLLLVFACFLLRAQDPIQNGEELVQQELPSLLEMELEPTDTALEQLSVLPLNDFQRFYLWKHIKRHGWPVLPQELLYLPGWDSTLSTNLWPYLPKTNPNRTYPAKGQFNSRWTWQPEPSKGLQSGTYPGASWSGWIFVGQKQRTSSWHLLLERDAGELQGVDFLSFHVKHQIKKWNMLLGDYQLRLGQGLAIWTGYPPMNAFEGSRYAPVLSPHQGREELRFMRGLATAVSWGKWRAYTILSSRSTSAAMREEGWFNLSTTSTFRTETERLKKNNLHHQLLGSAVEVNNERLSWGCFALFNRYSETYAPLNAQQFAQFGQYYRLFWKDFLLQGETTWSGGIAASTTLSWVVNDWTCFVQSVWRSTNFSAPLEASWLKNNQEIYRLGTACNRGASSWNAALELTPSSAVTRLSGNSKKGNHNLFWSLAIPLHDSTWRGMVGIGIPIRTTLSKLTFSATASGSWLVNLRIKKSVRNHQFMLCNQLAYVPNQGQALYGYLDGLPGDFLMQAHYSSGNVFSLVWKNSLPSGLAYGVRIEREHRFGAASLGSGQDQTEGPQRHLLSVFMGLKW